MRNYKQFLDNPWRIVKVLGAKGYFNWLPDKPFLQLMFYAQFGEKLNLDNPDTFNSKVQWLKLYDRDPLYTTLVDKYTVREYVEDKIGKEHLVPLLGVWDNAKEIDFSVLPNQFVLKCNHNSGTVIICKDKEKLDIKKTKKLLDEKLSRNFYYGGREWPYKDVKPRIICERYLENEGTQGLTDYKIYCFNGIPKMIMIATDRFTEAQAHFDYFDQDYNWLDLEWGNPRSTTPPSKPDKYDDMMTIAATLSEGIPEVRVDLYVVQGLIYFGEMTFFDGSGFQEITPKSWDYKLGSWIKLPQKEK